MVQRLRLHAAPQERALPVLQPKRTKSFDIIEHIIENGRLQKELPAPERGQAAIVDSAGLRDSQREPNVSAPRLQDRARTAVDRASAVTSANESGRKSAASETHPVSGQAANGGGGAPRPARFDPDCSSISDDGGWSRAASMCSAASAAPITSVASTPEVAAKARSRLGLKLKQAVVKTQDAMNHLHLLFLISLHTRRPTNWTRSRVSRLAAAVGRRDQGYFES